MLDYHTPQRRAYLSDPLFSECPAALARWKRIGDAFVAAYLIAYVFVGASGTY